MSELQTLALEILRDLRRNFDQRMAGLSQSQANQAAALKTLEARQEESEKLLQHLSKLYKRLLPLIENINNGVRNGPL